MCIYRRFLLAALALVPVAPLEAQDLFRVYRSDTYLSLGGGSGSFTFSCEDAACGNTKRTSSEFAFVFGYHATRRVRLEVAGHNQREGTDGNYLMTFSAGPAVYVWRNLHVRGAYAWLNPSVGDASGAYTGRGGGFLGGAAYDLHLWHMLALTPFANYFAGSIPTIERNDLGTITTTSGKANGMNFGVGLTFVGGAWDCVSRSGQHYRIKRFRRMSHGARSCLNEVDARVNASRSP
jgi:hypothetical protein